MDKDTDKSVRRFVRWLKDKIENKRSRDGDHDPWWVTLMLDVGRPAVAVMILTMCAPGEHHLGVMAGWSSGLAWLTPASLTAYAGISAVVATKRPKDAPGRNTAVWGAILSILLAMGAQPVAHLYEQNLITGHRLVLTVVVSVIPAAVFGHLLHMGAATPKSVRRTVSKPVKDKRTERADKVHGQTDMPWTEPAVSAALYTSRPSDSPSVSTWTGHAPTDKANRTPDTAVRQDTPVVPSVPAVRSIRNGSVSAAVREFLSRFPDATDTELSMAMSEVHPDTPWNSIYKARVRYEEKIGKRRTS